VGGGEWLVVFERGREGEAAKGNDTAYIEMTQARSRVSLASIQFRINDFCGVETVVGRGNDTLRGSQGGFASRGRLQDRGECRFSHRLAGLGWASRGARVRGWRRRLSTMLNYLRGNPLEDFAASRVISQRAACI